MLRQISRNSYYFDSKICIGVYIKDNKAILIDSGMDDDYARKVHNALKDHGDEIAAIINTHAHGDHYGGNRLLKERTGCKVYAPEFESVIMENPILEPIYLYGADPIEELKGKFFMGKASKPDFILKEGGDIEGLRIICVKGHSFNNIAVLTPDRVLYAGDAFFTSDVLDKYKIPYVYDVQNSLDSLDLIKALAYDHAVLAHGGLISKEDADLAIDKNISRIHEACEDIMQAITEPKSIEEVLTYLTKKHSLHETVPQHFLNLSIVKSYLSFLRKNKKADCRIDDARLVWQRQ
jgi:glyoxylase-like metal-dependent hydrolase (beta-lactamase superfamily II)